MGFLRVIPDNISANKYKSNGFPGATVTHSSVSIAILIFHSKWTFCYSAYCEVEICSSFHFAYKWPVLIAVYCIHTHVRKLERFSVLVLVFFSETVFWVRSPSFVWASPKKRWPSMWQKIAVRVQSALGSSLMSACRITVNSLLLY